MISFKRAALSSLLCIGLIIQESSGEADRLCAVVPTNFSLPVGRRCFCTLTNIVDAFSIIATSLARFDPNALLWLALSTRSAQRTLSGAAQPPRFEVPHEGGRLDTAHVCIAKSCQITRAMIRAAIDPCVQILVLPFERLERIVAVGSKLAAPSTIITGFLALLFVARRW